MKKILILIFIVTISNGCTTYISPYAAANPRHKFETNTRRYERKLRRLDRRETKKIDPLNFSCPRN
jgi:hypothetical protein